MTIPLPKALLLFFATACLAFSEEPVEEPAPDAIELTLEPKLGYPLTDHAVLQQKTLVPIWGTTLPRTNVTVTYNGQEKKAFSQPDGSWQVRLDPMVAEQLKSVNDTPTSHPLVITCEKDGEKAVTTIEDVVVGEVWLCAGQSNMAGKMRTTKSKHFPENSIELANYPAFRQLVSPSETEWRVCNPETAPEFKKVCFFFGREIQSKIMIPVGVINAAVGGSKIEAWLNKEPYETGQHYTNIIQPLIPYAIRGALWYQGESNSNDGYDYYPKLESLVTGWRWTWNRPGSTFDDGPVHAFPVYTVQLPGINTSDKDNPEMGDGRAGIRQAFLDLTRKQPKVGTAVCIDIGDVKEHPPNKYDTGYRLAQLALRNDYGFEDTIPSGPLYIRQQISGNTIRIFFNKFTSDGLMIAEKQGFLPPKPTPDAKLGWLSIQDKDGNWHWADAKIDGTELVVSSPEVSKPKAVRYAFTNNPTGPLLYNSAGLPASPFATDEPFKK